MCLNYNFYTQKDLLGATKLTELQNRAINLGLDLKGGLHIVLELDEKSFLKKGPKKICSSCYYESNRFLILINILAILMNILIWILEKTSKRIIYGEIFKTNIICFI